MKALRAWAGSVAAMLVAASVGTAVLAPPAASDSSPPVSGEPQTVTADRLPTVQINGVVWDQVIVGDRVYVTGSFS